MKPITWSAEKNQLLKARRGISFEDVLLHLQAGDILETFDHRNPGRRPRQQIHVIAIEECAVLVPFVESDEEVFLQAIIPLRTGPSEAGCERAGSRREGNP